MIKSKPATKKYRRSWDEIFKQVDELVKDVVVEDDYEFPDDINPFSPSIDPESEPDPQK